MDGGNKEISEGGDVDDILNISGGGARSRSRALLKCPCGKTYLHERSLSRHQERCQSILIQICHQRIVASNNGGDGDGEDTDDDGEVRSRGRGLLKCTCGNTYNHERSLSRHLWEASKSNPSSNPAPDLSPCPTRRAAKRDAIPSPNLTPHSAGSKLPKQVGSELEKTVYEEDDVVFDNIIGSKHK